MEGFGLNRDVAIDRGPWDSEPVDRAVRRFYRDLEMTTSMTTAGGRGEQLCGVIRLIQWPDDGQPDGGRAREQFRLTVIDPYKMEIEASDDLGIIYAFCHISRNYLGIEPFWFWNDQVFEPKEDVTVPVSVYESSPRPITFRGWFINDEVLISHWGGGRDPDYPWEMAFEALLRCGGNMVIPGTDLNSKRYARLASGMGLWITQHHAEPLGAEMFLRAYPDKNPSFKENPQLFRGLWEDSIKRLKDKKVIWNLGFRGQGDTPFWEQDPLYDTPQKRGGLISSIMMEQYDLVRSYVKDPVYCVNLYGEIMELYQQGYIRLPEDVIMIWADNGYGKMVSRRQWNHNPRVVSLPGKHLKDREHGVYYHVSFYDLQAANVLTMIPNSMEFVGKELSRAYERGVKDFWVINCSNIKPHVYPLDYIASLWNGEEKSAGEHLEEYIGKYYLGAGGRAGEGAVANGGTVPRDFVITGMKQCFQDYFKVMVPYGREEDEHAGEQFYNYVTRVFIHHWMKENAASPCEELEWCAPMDTFAEQIRWFGQVCGSRSDAVFELLERCNGQPNPSTGLSAGGARLWADSLLLQVKLHAFCIRGVLHFASAYETWLNREYMETFYRLGQSADWFRKADEAMKACGHGKWKGFYDNDCQTDIKETACLIRLLMGYVRNVDDGPYFYQWQRKVIYSERDSRILLLLNEENHLTDDELYQAMKKKQDGLNS